MDRLPAVLRREIWDYVHGDRAFWRRQFRTCLDQLGQPYNIRHQFEAKDSKQRRFFETLDLNSYPIHESRTEFSPYNSEIFRATLDEPGQPPLVRFSRQGIIANGTMVLHRESDIISDIIFTENVPDKVFLCFPDGDFWDQTEQRLCLKPIGSRLKLPWIPMVGVYLCQLTLRVDDETRIFPCEILHGVLSTSNREFLAEDPVTTTFQIDIDRFVIRYSNGFARIREVRPPNKPKQVPVELAVTNPPPPSSLFGVIRDFFGSLFSK